MVRHITPPPPALLGILVADVSYAHFLSSTHHEERDALIRLRASHHQQWAALYRLVDTTPFSEEKTLPFSPLDFQLSGAQLVSWHPSAQGGELALKTLWEAVPSAFTRLAERNVSVSRFSLSVEGDDLCSRYNWRRRMRVKRWLLAGIALCLLTGMRDPFKPPEDLCRISELSQWRYQGMVGRGERIIGVIKTGKEMATGAAKRCAGKRLDNFTADARRTNAGYRDKLRTATMVVATARRYK